jgi:hypothetical protein
MVYCWAYNPSWFTFEDALHDAQSLHKRFREAQSKGNLTFEQGWELSSDYIDFVIQATDWDLRCIRLHPGHIVGIILGGLIILGLIIGLLVCIAKAGHRRKLRNQA